MSFCRRLLASDGLQAARDFAIPAELVGKFLVERTCTLLLHDPDLRTERTLHLKARWHPNTRKSLGSMDNWTFPVTSDSDDPQLKLTVLPASAFTGARRFLEAPSPAGRAAANLMHAVGCAELIPTLFDLERRHSGSLIPLGIEIQTPFTVQREHESLGWKQALRALGIPSPRRPEYRSMVEASVPPALSFVTQQVIPLLLERIGFFAEPIDLALHLSFSPGRWIRRPIICSRPSSSSTSPASVRRSPPESHG